jgi:hypothetical protein
VGFASLFPAEHPKTVAFQDRLERLAKSVGEDPGKVLAQSGPSAGRPACRVKLLRSR